MFDLTSRNINRLFVFSFKLGRNMTTRNTFNRQYFPFVEIKDFNLSVDKLFFVQPVKNKQEAYDKLVEMSRNDYTTGNILDYLYHQKY